MSLVAAPRANNLSQLNTVTEIKYSNRNSTARDHAMIAARSGTPVHAPALSSGTVQARADIEGQLIGYAIEGIDYFLIVRVIRAQPKEQYRPWTNRIHLSRKAQCYGDCGVTHDAVSGSPHELLRFQTPVGVCGVIRQGLSRPMKGVVASGLFVFTFGEPEPW
jgi:hypothetical protein